jgi:hypothetical protein
LRIHLIDRFVTSKGEIERPIAGEGWLRPSAVDLGADGELAYRFEPPLSRIRPQRGMVRAFLQLAEAPDQEILRFARRWGALTKSALHPLTQEPWDDNPIARAVHVPETTEDWRLRCRAVTRVLELAARLEDAPSTIVTNERRNRARREVEEMQKEIIQEINMGLFASVRPQLVLSPSGPTIRLHVDGLSGALAAELLLMVARKDGLALCQACGSPFETDGRRKVYCVSCGTRAAWRAASGNYYKAKKHARELFDRGVPIENVADSVGRSIVVIRRWREKWIAGKGKDGNKKTRRK